MPVYYDGSGGAAGEIAAVLAIGDSWFWYPFEGNLLSELSKVVKPDYASVLALGYNGATLRSYVEGVHASAIARALHPNRLPYYSAVLISGGGNDVVDWDLCLNRDCAGCAAPDCLNPSSISAHLGQLKAWVAALVARTHQAFDAARLRRPDVFVHTYDVAPPNGVAARLPLAGVPIAGPWIAPALDRARVDRDAALRQDVVRRFMAELERTYAELDDPAQRVHVVRSQGTLAPVDWANELHPTGRGFGKLAGGPWRQKMKETGFV